jgi:hypothetical protein
VPFGILARERRWWWLLLEEEVACRVVLDEEGTGGARDAQHGLPALASERGPVWIGEDRLAVE